MATIGFTAFINLDHYFCHTEHLYTMYIEEIEITPEAMDFINNSEDLAQYQICADKAWWGSLFLFPFMLYL